MSKNNCRRRVTDQSKLARPIFIKLYRLIDWAKFINAASNISHRFLIRLLSNSKNLVFVKLTPKVGTITQ